MKHATHRPRPALFCIHLQLYLNPLLKLYSLCPFAYSTLLMHTFQTCHQVCPLPLYQVTWKERLTATSHAKPLDRHPLPSSGFHIHTVLSSLALTVCRKPVGNTEEIITNVSNLERDQSSWADKKKTPLTNTAALGGGWIYMLCNMVAVILPLRTSPKGSMKCSPFALHWTRKP